MPLIEAALAFAITMFALSLICSSFVEIIHRAFKLRENGLQYMIGQLLDQVLVRYADTLVEKEKPGVVKENADAVAAARGKADEKPQDKGLAKKLSDLEAQSEKSVITQAAIGIVRDKFVARMVANRAPVGLKADPKLAAVPVLQVGDTPKFMPGNMWGGRRVTALTTTDFMERLGATELGEQIRRQAVVRGQSPVDGDALFKQTMQVLDPINVADDFDKKVVAGHKERDVALSLIGGIDQTIKNFQNAVGNAAAAVGDSAADAVDATLKDIAQKFDGFGRDAASYFEGRARFMSVMVAILLAIAVHVDAFDLFKTYLRDPNARAKAIEQSEALTTQYKAVREAADAAAKISMAPAVENANIKAEFDEIKQKLEAATRNLSATVTQFADLGAPLGWTDARMKAAHVSVWFWTCKEFLNEKSKASWSLQPACKSDDGRPYAGAGGLQYVDPIFWLPRSPSVWLALVLGGLLIGLGSPFWYDAVTGLTNLRSGAKDASPALGAAKADKAQPVTPVGAFKVSDAARGQR